ncbi:uncharacterized protein [Gossypium hirsutum]|uniref:Uncharacterized protein n=1 Tax=Gossypium hirsutum TaxID=3635 RepID=A0ABM2ZM37_GOSHI|nr:uncharacterized protein LOC121213794 [Gossypium hirsutum]
MPKKQKKKDHQPSQRPILSPETKPPTTRTRNDSVYRVARAGGQRAGAALDVTEAQKTEGQKTLGAAPRVLLFSARAFHCNGFWAYLFSLVDRANLGFYIYILKT